MGNTRKVVHIDKRIIGWDIKRDDAAAAADTDPRRVRIDRREEGSWESVTTKFKLPSGQGTKTIYFVIGFGIVCGRHHGKPVCIERPLEFFVPAGQIASEYQWISATMRTLSLAARGGFVTKALADLRKVSWDRGPVWFGKTKSGKTRVHDSEVAAIAWAIQAELCRRGFLDENGNENSVEELAALYERIKGYRESMPLDNPKIAATNTPHAETQKVAGQTVIATCPDPHCRGEMVMKDGCPVCLDCGYSKCG